MATPPDNDPITSHVLDQTSGTPAVGVSMTLYLLAPTSSSSSAPASAPALDVFRATTAPGSGRVGRWTRDAGAGTGTAVVTAAGSASSAQSEIRLGEVLKALKENGSSISEWVLVLDTAAYWASKGGKTFYPRVRIDFSVDQTDGRDHWHVPVLLGPHGYTTYRGT